MPPFHKKSFPALFLSLAIISIVFISCEKEVHINLNTNSSTLVVDGQIENGLPPYVFLTHTIGFFSTVDLKTLQNSFIHGATVTVSDGIKTITLKEYSIDSAGSQLYFYSIDSSNILTGIVNKTYTLNINYNGTTYTSVTKIPYVKGLDTMWADKPLSGNDNIPINAKEIFVNYTDPDTIGNYVRLYTKRNNEPYYPGAVFSDEIINGTTVKQIEIRLGYADSANAKEDSLSYAYSGDSITVKWCEIDKGVYDFWNTFNFSQQAAGNPFSSPINVKTNINNGALGIWAGYSSSYKTILVQ